MSELMHVGRSKRDGAPVGSGRYPLGSGDDPYQHGNDFHIIVNRMKHEGKTEREIAEELGVLNKKGEPDVVKLRAKVSIAKNQELSAQTSYAIRLKKKGYSQTEIARRMNVSEGKVRDLLKKSEQRKDDILTNVANELKSEIDKDNRYIDIGPGTETYIAGVTSTKLKTAVAMLEEQGYVKITIQSDQMGLNPNKKTYITVLCPPGTTYKDVVNNKMNIKSVECAFEDHGAETVKLHYPQAISADRVMVRYKEEGGAEKDGVIEIRRGVADLDLGEKQFAQVRINVDNSHYLKGMAMYAAEDMPPGIDIIYNSNKHQGVPKMSDDPKAKQVFKVMDDPNAPVNPFGSTIRKQQGALNLMKEEGDWDKQQDRLAAQFLSKQQPELAKKQLYLATVNRQDELEEIMSLTNPVVRKKYLKDFADSCDSAAVELHAAALPRQSWKVILPIQDLKDNEIYAPTYKNGEKVVLVRYPHGGTFEIPELIVNNNHPTANKVMHNAEDAVGINAHVAERLSGADFDGDTVLVIPTKNVKIRTSAPLAGLKDFDPKELYQRDDLPEMKNQTKQMEMGKVSNLITDMTIKGVEDPNELARAVRHSMVVIDAQKHHLDYIQSEKDNRIQELKDKYQAKPEPGKKGGGASTLISRSKSKTYVNARKMNYKINPENGEKIWIETNEHWVNKKGETVYRKQESKQMADAQTPEEVRKLSSGTAIENIYADYAIDMKALGDKARKLYLETPNQKYSPSAKKVYEAEVQSLNRKLLIAKQNKPRERQAILLADYIYQENMNAHPEWAKNNEKKKKARGQAISDARQQVGAHKEKISITEREWEAIQAGAITNNKLREILDNSDPDKLRELAMPKKSKELRPSQIARMKAMQNSGYSLSEIAEALGVSPSTVSRKLKE